MVRPERPEHAERTIAKEQAKANPKARGGYRKKECPYCHKMVGNLGNHVNALHKTPDGQGAPPAPPAAPVEMTWESLVSGVKPPVVQSAALQTYYCTACKAELRKGENPCWHCGENLVWDGIL